MVTYNKSISLAFGVQGYVLLEDSEGFILLEDSKGDILLEGPAEAIYVQNTVNKKPKVTSTETINLTKKLSKKVSISNAQAISSVITEIPFGYTKAISISNAETVAANVHTRTYNPSILSSEVINLVKQIIYPILIINTQVINYIKNLTYPIATASAELVSIIKAVSKQPINISNSETLNLLKSVKKLPSIINAQALNLTRNLTKFISISSVDYVQTVENEQSFLTNKSISVSNAETANLTKQISYLRQISVSNAETVNIGRGLSKPFLITNSENINTLKTAIKPFSTSNAQVINLTELKFIHRTYNIANAEAINLVKQDQKSTSLISAQLVKIIKAVSLPDSRFQLTSAQVLSNLKTANKPKIAITNAETVNSINLKAHNVTYSVSDSQATLNVNTTSKRPNIILNNIINVLELLSSSASIINNQILQVFTPHSPMGTAITDAQTVSNATAFSPGFPLGERQLINLTNLISKNTLILSPESTRNIYTIEKVLNYAATYGLIVLKAAKKIFSTSDAQSISTSETFLIPHYSGSISTNETINAIKFVNKIFSLSDSQIAFLQNTAQKPFKISDAQSITNATNTTYVPSIVSISIRSNQIITNTNYPSYPISINSFDFVHSIKHINKSFSISTAEFVTSPQAHSKILSLSSNESFKVISVKSKIFSLAFNQTFKIVRNLTKLIKITNPELILTKKAITKQPISITNAETVLTLKSDIKKLAITNSEAIDKVTFRQKVEYITEAESINLIKQANKLILTLDSKSLSLTKNLTKLISVSSAESFKLLKHLIKHTAIVSSEAINALINKTRSPYIFTGQHQTANLIKQAYKLILTLDSQSINYRKKLAKLISISSTEIINLTKSSTRYSAILISDSQSIARKITYSKRSLIVQDFQHESITKSISKIPIQTSNPELIHLSKSANKILSISDSESTNLQTSLGYFTPISISTSNSSVINLAYQIFRFSFNKKGWIKAAKVLSRLWSTPEHLFDRDDID